MSSRQLKPFTAKFSSETLAQVRIIAEQERLTPGAIIRGLVVDALVQRQKAKPPAA